ncbi:MAG: 16S rRNA (uracil(1498)-N(3))-methyltransferase [Bacteroidales bacterium]|jgi:16S rRNA (uracil1498-N3)-methyltransferase|nr:16S rRNA (uracil(1498)-N(3))-methyltransferase [Bacteroidales bacterium]
MIIFYCEDIETNPVLSEEDSAHAVRVLRHVEGDEVTVVDGKGRYFRCAIIAAHPKHCGLQILAADDERHWPYSVQLAVAPTKNLDRMEWWLEKATEMGLDRFTPLKCRFSERKEIKTERMRKIAISAMKQSLKATLPQIDEMTDIKSFVQEPFDGQKFIAHCMKDEPRKLLTHEVRPDADVRVLIGPEGDFSADEVALAIQNGYVPVSLGEQRLRTETAALAAVHTVHVINELNQK